MSISVPYTRVLHYHLSFRDSVTGPNIWENGLNNVADQAFAAWSVGQTFNLQRALREEARACNVHRWARSDGALYTMTEAWSLLTETEWAVFDATAKGLFSSIWLRKLEAVRRVTFN